jgi:hypothetical protein
MEKNNKNKANSVRIYVVTHKQTPLPEHESYIPTVVGNHSVVYDNAVYDNTGINIAEKNGNYCELTALYWIWKNLKDPGVYGMCHYRRFFHNKSVKGKTALDFKKIPRYFKKHDIVLPLPFFWENNTVQRQLIDSSISEYNFGLIKDAISVLYPEYISAYDEVFSGHYASYCNMFILPSKEMLDDYCKWLFDILFYIEKNTDLSNATDYEKRIYGFISERLLNVWVRKNCFRVKYLHVDEGNCKVYPAKDLRITIQTARYGIFGRNRLSKFIIRTMCIAITNFRRMLRKI